MLCSERVAPGRWPEPLAVQLLMPQWMTDGILLQRLKVMAKNVHPLIDILKYGKSSYPPDIDDLVRSLTTYPGYQPASERIGKILWDDWPTLPGVKSDFERVRHELRKVERELQRLS